MDASLNIVDLIENNAITRLSQTYQHKLLTKNEQQLFPASFYCYLKHDTLKDFVIDLDEVWKLLGFKQKVNAKTLVEKWFEKNRFCCNKSKQFTIDLHYKLLLNLQVKQ